MGNPFDNDVFQCIIFHEVISRCLDRNDQVRYDDKNTKHATKYTGQAFGWL